MYYINFANEKLVIKGDKIMKFFNTNINVKKVIIITLIVMLFNFMAPVVSQADFGGALFKPISQLLCGIADLVIKAAQKIFIGYGDIRVENPR